MIGNTSLIGRLVAAMLVLPLWTAVACADEWRIERMSGDVRIHDGTDWVQLESGRTLLPGDSVWTGRNGRILIANDQGSVLLAPRSLVKIPTQTLPNGLSVLFQTHGSVTVEAEKRRKRHFSIQTPYVAAVVKGTRYTVEIGDDDTNVSVEEGLVGVVDVETRKEQVDVPAGSVAVALNALGLKMSVGPETDATGVAMSTSNPTGTGGSRVSGGGDSSDPGPGNPRGYNTYDGDKAKDNSPNGNAYAYGNNKDRD